MIRLLETYKKVFKSPLFSLFMIAYTAIAVFYFYRIQERRNMEEVNLIQRDLQERIIQLNEMIKDKNELAIRNQYSFMKNMEIRDTLLDKTDKGNIERMIEYADFAIQKKDFEYAEKFYEDANQTYNYSITHYYLGKLYYRQNNIDDAIREFRTAISLDKKEFYPEYRFYLAILLHEINNESESKKYIKNYLE